MAKLNTLMEVLLSGDSDSSGDEPVVNRVLSEVYQHRQKNELYLENIAANYSDEEFQQHFRVSREILQNLAVRFAASDWFPQVDTGFERVTAEHSLWIFCWYAGHEAAGFRDVADRFNIAISTLHLLIHNVSRFLSNLSPTVITWPSPEEQQKISADFVEMGFVEGVIGCVDGTHFKIDKPKDDADSYCNRKKYFSIQMQAVCDSQRRIRDVFIGYPGSVHDARVFRNSGLAETLATRCGGNFILGDTAYPCLKNIMTPYKDFGNLTEVQSNFNTKLGQCRVRIEHTFGILKQKFRNLYHIKLRDIDTICHFIRACCVLHNLSLNNEDNITDENNDAPENMDDNEDVEYNNVGDNFRNYLAAMLYEIRGAQ